MEGKLMRACSNSRERGKPKPKLKKEELEQLILVQMAMPTRVSEFYVLDLETEKITKKPVATLVNQGYADGYTVYLGSMIYCVGGHLKEDMITTLPKFIAAAGDHHIHSHTSRANLSIPCDRLLQTTDPPGPDDVDADAHAADAVARKGGLDLEPTRFEAGPKMLYSLFQPRCAVLDGKIYAFASCKIGEVFEPEDEGEVGEWKALPPIPSSIIVTHRDHPSNLYVSNPVIPDHKNHRIIVHVDPICHLFAYYPQLGTWECLDQEYMSDWYPATALVDDVLYVHTEETPKNCISAYDLSSKAWLNVSYYDDKYLYPQRFCYAENATMLPLGNNVLCLANSCTYKLSDDPRRSDLSFIRFKVQRTSPQEVLVTLIDSKCFTLDGYYEAKHFILL